MFFIPMCHLSFTWSTIIYFFCRGESILLFLVQTVGRQSVEQRQYRVTRPRSATRKTPSSEIGTFLLFREHSKSMTTNYCILFKM